MAGIKLAACATSRSAASADEAGRLSSAARARAKRRFTVNLLKCKRIQRLTEPSAQGQYGQNTEKNNPVTRMRESVTVKEKTA
ncbi:hypothetical protein JCM16814_32650 [Desulfobaculum senezii]